MAIDEEHPRLDWHLDNWAQYLRTNGLKELDCKTSRYWTRNDDFDSKADRAENEAARTVDAVVWDLPPMQRLSVNHRVLGTVAFASASATETFYQLGRLSISSALRRRGVP